MTDTKFVRGADKLKIRIATIRKNLNLPAFTEEIATLLVGRTKRRFASELDPNNTKWKRLKASTLRRKRAAGAGDAGVLVRTGKLRDSIGLIRGGFRGFGVNTGAGFRIGVQDPKVARYAVAHQQGLGIPVRRIVGVGELDIKAVDTLMRRKARQLERAGV